MDTGSFDGVLNVFDELFFVTFTPACCGSGVNSLLGVVVGVGLLGVERGSFDCVPKLFNETCLAILLNLPCGSGVKSCLGVIDWFLGKCMGSFEGASDRVDAMFVVFRFSYRSGVSSFCVFFEWCISGVGEVRFKGAVILWIAPVLRRLVS